MLFSNAAIPFRVLTSPLSVQEMTIPWCLKRAELVFKCVKGNMKVWNEAGFMSWDQLFNTVSVKMSVYITLFCLYTALTWFNSVFQAESNDLSDLNCSAFLSIVFPISSNLKSKSFFLKLKSFFKEAERQCCEYTIMQCRSEMCCACTVPLSHVSSLGLDYEKQNNIHYFWIVFASFWKIFKITKQK